MEKKKKRSIAGFLVVAALLGLVFAIGFGGEKTEKVSKEDEEFLRQAKNFEASQQEPQRRSVYDSRRLQPDFDKAAQSFQESFDTQWQAHERTMRGEWSAPAKS